MSLSVGQGQDANGSQGATNIGILAPCRAGLPTLWTRFWPSGSG